MLIFVLKQKYSKSAGAHDVNFMINLTQRISLAWYILDVIKKIVQFLSPIVSRCDNRESLTDILRIISSTRYVVLWSEEKKERTWKRRTRGKVLPRSTFEICRIHHPKVCWILVQCAGGDLDSFLLPFQNDLCYAYAYLALRYLDTIVLRSKWVMSNCLRFESESRYFTCNAHARTHLRVCPMSFFFYSKLTSSTSVRVITQETRKVIEKIYSILLC